MASRESSRPHPATSMNTPSTRPHRSSPLNPNSQTQNATPSATTTNPAEAAAPASKPTPYRTLLQISKPTTPNTTTSPRRRASSAGPSTSSRHAEYRTPAPAARTPSARLGGSARRPGTMMTPHGRAALREVEARRAGFTPGPQDRRRSGRQQRETPRDTLRALSRLLAPKTEPTVPTPPAGGGAKDEEEEGKGKVLKLPTRRGEEDFDDDEVLPRPRLSLPLGEDDDEDDSLLEPPRSSGLEDENITVRSVEMARRAALDRGPGRLSRGSFGSVGLGDQVLGELNQSGLDVGGVFDSSFDIGDRFPDDQVLDDVDDGFQADTTAISARGRLSLAESDIRPSLLADDTENTFVFTVPPPDVPDLQRSDDTVESPPRDDDENHAWDDMDAGIPSDGEGGWTGVVDTDNVDASMLDPSADSTTMHTHAAAAPRKKTKRIKISKHGIQYPSLPAGVVKKLATTYARTSGHGKAKISKDTLDAIMQASDWFFEQVSDDLGAYAEHAGRKTIEESDVVALMGRQRQINAATTPFSLAQRYLPRELLQELRMVPPAKIKRSRQLERVDEAEEDDEE